jgi:hypothetical protein
MHFFSSQAGNMSTFLILLDFLILMYVEEEGHEVPRAVFSIFRLLFHES